MLILCALLIRYHDSMLFFLVCGFCILLIFCLIIMTSFWRTADTGKVDIVMNVVERPSGGFSAGGGISSG